MIQLLKPHMSSSPLIRLGNKSDGGYVLPKQVIFDSQALYTYGVGRKWRFEDDYFKMTNNPIYMFDPNIESAPYHFTKQGLGGSLSATCDTFLKHHRGEQCILKMDVEGAEYDFWENTDACDLKGVLCIIMEIHHLQARTQRAELILENILQRFVLIHLHGNNWGKQFDCEGHRLPVTLELTFLASSYPTTVSNLQYPVDGIDFPNRKGREDYRFSFLEGEQDIRKAK